MEQCWVTTAAELAQGGGNLRLVLGHPGSQSKVWVWLTHILLQVLLQCTQLLFKFIADDNWGDLKIGRRDHDKYIMTKGQC